MGRIFHPRYTRPIPASAKISTIRGQKVTELKIRGVVRACEVKTIAGRHRAVVELTDRWAIEWTDEHGKTRNKTIGRDKRAATAALARYEERAARLRHGLPDLAADARARGRPLIQVIDEYLEVLAGGDTSAGYRQHTRARLLAIQAGCGWQCWGDVRADDLVRFLGRLRDDQGLSLSTLNGYARAAKGFCNWYAESLRERSPLKAVKSYPEQKERRRSRRILTDEEFQKLLEAARCTPRRFNATISGPDRAVLYLVAAYSGLRASELARLGPKNLHLETDPPGIVVYGKGKREEFTPIPGHLARDLRAWISSKRPVSRLWPGRWAQDRHQAKWIKRDAERAGLGAGVTFHSLRRRYVTALLRAGNAVDVVRRLARHRDLRTTMSFYAEIVPGDLKRAVETLQGPRVG